MVEQLKQLTPTEQRQLFDAIPMITVLVAGADDNIDAKELKWAEKITHIRAYGNQIGIVRAYYEYVDAELEASTNRLMNWLSDDPNKREEQLTEELKKLNDIFPKLDADYAKALYQSFLSFSEHIAKASGGFFRFMTIGPKEEKVVDLPMLTPVE